MNDSGLTTSALVAALKDRGYDVSHDKLERWRSAGLIFDVSGEQKSGSRGRPQYTHPPETLTLCLALLSVDPKPKNLASLEFEAWWKSGVNPARGARQVLHNAVQPIANFTRRLLGTDSNVREDRGFEVVEQIADQASQSEWPIVNSVRNNLDAGPDAVNTVLVALVQLVFGRSDVIEVNTDAADEPTAQALVWKGLALDDASKSVAQIQPWLKDDVPAMACDLAAAMRAGLFRFSRYPDFITKLSDADIERARQDARAMTSDLPDVLDSIGLRYGSRAFGFGYGSRALRVLGSTVTLKAISIVAMARMRVFCGNHNVESLLASSREDAPAARVWIAVAKRFPYFRQLLKIDNQWQIQSLSQSKRDAILSFIQNHPDGAPIISTAARA